ncbi:MAG TPA: site-specific integrase [Mycobacterium sp.]|nr:site-specific integrase [Mycobacterium sp.]
MRASTRPLPARGYRVTRSPSNDGRTRRDGADLRHDVGQEVAVGSGRGEHVAEDGGEIEIAYDRWDPDPGRAPGPGNAIGAVDERGVKAADLGNGGAEGAVWIATIRKTSGPTTVIRAYGVLAGILDDAVKSRRLTANPSRGMENLPHKTGKRRVYLTVEDLARLASESGQHSALVLTLAYTGIRWGEAVALRVRDVQFLRRRLTVADSAVQLGVDHAVGRTKSRTERSVPVPQFVLDQLAVQCEGRSLDDLVFGDDGTTYLPRPKSDGGWFAGAMKRAKVQRISPHDLRHSCASIAISSGVNVLALSRMLGHKSAKVTLDTYAIFSTPTSVPSLRLLI